MPKRFNLLILAMALSACEYLPSKRFPQEPGQFAVSEVVTRDYSFSFPVRGEVNGEFKVFELALSLEDISGSECFNKATCHYANLGKISFLYDGNVMLEAETKSYYDEAGQPIRFWVKDNDGIDSACKKVGSISTALYAYVGEKGREPDFQCDDERATKEYGLNGASHWLIQEGKDPWSAMRVHQDGENIIRFHIDGSGTVLGVEVSLADKEKDFYLSGSSQ